MPYLWINEATEIKLLLREGYPQAEIAARFKVSQATVSRILTGDQWADAPWPDGSTDGASFELMGEILNKRRQGGGFRKKSETSSGVRSSEDSPASIEQAQRIQEQEDADALKRVMETREGK